MSDSNNGQNGIVLTPKSSFILGIVGGVLVLCSLGFFVLLGLLISGKMVSDSNDVTTPKIGANQPSVPTPTAPEADPVGEVIPVTSADHVTGAKNAKVTLITYSDFECPYCGNFHSTMNQLMADYGDEVRWVYRNFPLSFHANAVPAANAAECAAEQGKFWEFADGLFANQSALNATTYGNLAKQLKLNVSKFDSCVSAKKFQSRIDSDQAGGSQAGVTGTPGTIIIAADGSKSLIPGALPLASVKSMVDAALAK